MKRIGGRKSRRVAVTAASASLILPSLLGGLALVVFSLRDLHLRLEIKGNAEEEGRGQGTVS